MTDAPTPDATSPAPVAHAKPRRALLLSVFAGLAVFAYMFDQLTKIWVTSTMVEGERIPVLPPLLHWYYIRNPGAAFSIGDGSTWLLTAVSIAILVWVVIGARKVGNMPWAVALGLLLGGALGNLIDRVFRAPGPGQGHVVDFIDYFGLFIGNVADIAIVVGAGIIMVLSFRGTSLAGPVHHPEHADD
jgi:signal peptidase II